MVREGRLELIPRGCLGGGCWNGEAGEREDGSGRGDLQHAVALVPNGEEALVVVGARGPFPILDVLAGGEPECLDRVVVEVHVGWQCLLVGIS